MKPPQVGQVAAQSVVVVVTDQPSIQSCDEVLARQVPVALDLASGTQRRADSRKPVQKGRAGHLAKAILGASDPG